MFSQELVERLQHAKSIVIFTGAGVSAESGVPTFRGEDGIWKKMKPEELANFDSFLRNPALVWEWYLHRKKIMTSIEPNAGHFAIAELEKYFPSVITITQNIDNLHRRAGSTKILELHGNIERNYCIQCKTKFDNEEIFSMMTPKIETISPPRCTKCNGLIRPDVVWFGEHLPENVWDEAVKATKHCDLFFSVGTTAVVYPAASLIEHAKKYSSYIVEVNIEETPMSYYVDEHIHGKSGEVFPQLLSQLSTHKQNKVTNDYTAIIQ